MAEIRIIASEAEGAALIDALTPVVRGWRVTDVRGPRRSRRDDRRLWYLDIERLPAGDAGLMLSLADIYPELDPLVANALR